MPVPKKKYDVMVVGEVNPDLILSGDVEPAFGQVEKLLEGAVLTIGSSSAIFACGAARLGLKVAFTGKTGCDVFGDFMRQALKRRGIDVSGIIVDPALQTGLSVILSKRTDRAILTYQGAIAALRIEEVAWSRVRRARHLHLGSYFMQAALRPEAPRLFRAAHELGLTTSLDTNYDPSGRWGEGLFETLAHTDIFLPNEAELLAITRLDKLEAALEKLAGLVGVVGVKLGARGGAAARGKEIVRAEALPVEVVDTTGAGDTFDAGFIYGFLQGWSLEKTLRLACVCGSLSTRAAGGTEGQPGLEEALKCL
jgi:sugar/nucleoside kinase (ribokinase family)